MFDITSDKVYVKTFGGFDLYYQGELIYFSSSKAKELLAILVAVSYTHLDVYKRQRSSAWQTIWRGDRGLEVWGESHLNR